VIEAGRITIAYSDIDWESGGAAVRVSLVGFGGMRVDDPALLDGTIVSKIHADLTSGTSGRADLTRAARLRSNFDVAFMATTKGGAFDIPGDLARQWLTLPQNVNGRPNADVLRPWLNGMDVTRRPAGKWIIDFNVMPERDAAAYETPFEHLRKLVRPEREQNRRESYRTYWWRFVEPRQGMRAKLAGKVRYIATPTVSKHRLFVWLPSTVCADHQLIVIARDDDLTFGILHSRLHEVWSLRLGTWLGVGNDPRYTPSTTFETFPFPDGLTPDLPATDYAAHPRAQNVAAIAAELVRLRDNWLNPQEWVKRVPEVVPGYPDRLLPVDDKAAAELKKRTLTNLYNQRPTWLANAHKALDEAVAAAYGWPADLSDDEILARLFALNQERAAAEAKG
jgi:type II restriction/modification system DNA methylase subunit YeeA